MKKLLILSMFFFTCNHLHELQAQEKTTVPPSWDDVNKKATEVLKQTIKTEKIVKAKVFPKPVHDTVWLATDTVFVYDMTYEDSARIVAHFRGTDEPVKEKTKTRVGKAIRSIVPKFLR